MKVLRLIGLLTIFPSTLGTAMPVPLTILPGGAFTMQYRFSTGQSTAPIPMQVSGNLTGDVEFSGNSISKFSFLGGNVAYSDSNAEVIVPTFTKIRVETRNIVAALTSHPDAGAIDPITGVITNSGHFLLQNRGTVRTRYIVFGAIAQEELRDLATRPDTSPLVGVTSVTSSLLADLGYQKRYRIDLLHTRNESRTQPVELINGTVNITEVGSFSATGEVQLLGQAFVQWCHTQRGQTPVTLGDVHGSTGQPLILLYAFNSTNGPWSPPVSFDPANGTMTLQLPSSGLQAPVRVEFSDSLAGGSWTTLLKSDLQPALFTTGEAGSVTLPVPPGPVGFIRLSLANP